MRLAPVFGRWRTLHRALLRLAGGSRAPLVSMSGAAKKWWRNGHIHVAAFIFCTRARGTKRLFARARTLGRAEQCVGLKRINNAQATIALPRVRAPLPLHYALPPQHACGGKRALCAALSHLQRLRRGFLSQFYSNGRDSHLPYWVAFTLPLPTVHPCHWVLVCALHAPGWIPGLPAPLMVQTSPAAILLSHGHDHEHAFLSLCGILNFFYHLPPPPPTPPRRTAHHGPTTFHTTTHHHPHPHV